MSGGMYGTGGAGQATIFTDDVSLQVFMEHLKRLVCGLIVSCQTICQDRLTYLCQIGRWSSDELDTSLLTFFGGRYQKMLLLVPFCFVPLLLFLQLFSPSTLFSLLLLFPNAVL